MWMMIASRKQHASSQVSEDGGLLKCVGGMNSVSTRNRWRVEMLDQKQCLEHTCHALETNTLHELILQILDLQHDRQGRHDGRRWTD